MRAPAAPALLAPLALLTCLSAQEKNDTWLGNGGGESKKAIRLGTAKTKPYFDLPAWRVVRGSWVAQTGGWYGVEPVAGEVFLRTGKKDDCELQQELEVTGLGKKPPRFLILTAHMRTLRGKDAGELRLSLLDAAGTILATRSTGLRKDKKWTRRQLLLALPPKALRIRVTLLGKRYDGKWTDACFDEVSLEGIGPGYPRRYAGWPDGDLIDQYEDTPTDKEATRRQLTLAMASGETKALRYLGGLFDREKDRARRQELLMLLCISSHKESAKVLKRVLERGSRPERSLVFAHRVHLPFDWRGVAARLARKEKNEKLRLDLLRHLAESQDQAALRLLLGIHANGNKSMQLSVLKALRGVAFDPDQIYRSFLAPHLGVADPPELRCEAMRVLGRLRDERYLRHLTQLFAVEKSRSYRAAWFRWCAAFDTVAALETMLPLVEKGLPRAGSAFLESAPKMQSEEVGSWMRREGIHSDLPAIRQAAVRQIGHKPRAGDLARLRNCARDTRCDVALEAVDALARLTGTGLGEELLGLVAEAQPRVAAAAMRALWKLEGDSARALGAAREAVGNSPHWHLRVAALDLLKDKHAATCRALILGNFEHSSRQVRTAAYRAVSFVRERASIEALLGRLATEKSSTLDFLRASLTNLTRVDKGADPKLWQAWWTLVKADFLVSPRSEKERGKVQSAGVGAGAGAGRQTRARYYDIPLRCDRVVFLIDLSGSMRSEIEKQTKLQKAKDELIAVLKALDAGMSFGIIGFGDWPEAFEPRLLPASKPNIVNARKWVERLRISGWTNIYDSLEMALSIEGVESIFLLSDGEPSVGKIVGMDQIRRAIKRRNAALMVRIHAISIGGGKRAHSFMQKLANENHGTAK